MKNYVFSRNITLIPCCRGYNLFRKKDRVLFSTGQRCRRVNRGSRQEIILSPKLFVFFQEYRCAGRTEQSRRGERQNGEILVANYGKSRNSVFFPPSFISIVSAVVFLWPTREQQTNANDGGNFETTARPTSSKTRNYCFAHVLPTNQMRSL